MTAGSSDKMRRMIAGLLVLAVLLVSGAQALVAAVPHSHLHDGSAGQATAVAAHGLTTPVHDDDCDHGLPCCIGGQCVVHAYCIAAGATTLPARPRLAVAVVPMPQLSLSGIVIRPSAPPPRATV